MTALALDLALRGTAVLGVALVLVVLLRRASAAWRHLVWCLAFTGLLALPLLAATVPAWNLDWPGTAATGTAVAAAPTTEHAAPAAAVPAPTATADRSPVTAREPLPAKPQAAHAPSPVPAATALPVENPSVGLSLDTWLLAVWAAGVVAALLPVAVGLVSLRRLGRQARLVAEGPAFDLLHGLIDELGLRGTVRLVESDRRSVPMTWGLRRPVVLLPEGARSWSADRLRAVLLHELAHVRRRDCLTQLLARVACALYWFHPLAWLGLRRLRVEQERACDDVVVHAGQDAADYAVHLLAVTSGLQTGAFGSAVALAMSASTRLESRLAALLDVTRSRRPVGGRGGGRGARTAVALLVPLASVRGVPLADGTDEAPQGQARDPGKVLDEVRAKVRERYVQAPNDRQMLQGAIKGMLATLHDPYAEYFSPEATAEFTWQVQGGRTGIGAQLATKDGQITVVTPLADSPALKAGVRPGDVIQEIDGQPARGLELNAAVQRIIGKQGTAVKLKVRHGDGQEETLAITRAPLRIETVKGFRRDAEGHRVFLLDPDQKIGYLHIEQLSAATAQDARDAIEGLKRQGMKGLILDLRSCPGGLLNAALALSNLFLTKGTIVTVRGANNQEQKFEAEAKNALGDFPLLVLVNGQTASAAEIIAGALKDNGRAVVLGSRTFGKGSVQELVKLPDDTGTVKLTTAHFYGPSGRNLQRRDGEPAWGVDPTEGYLVPVTGEQSSKMQEIRRRQDVLGRKDAPKAAPKVTPQTLETDFADPQLAAALKTMTARLTGGQFVRVGPGDGELAARVARREEAEKQRAELLKNLDKVNRELAELEKAIKDGKEKP